jgi:hypothetical protein
MTVQVRLLKALLDQMRSDLARPHPFAFERVGFVRARLGNRDGDPLLVLLTEYVPVPDADYIPDKTCGARINGVAIRRAMQQVLTDGQGTFHVHMHHRPGKPALSRTDVADLPRIVSSFHAVGAQAAHGILLLSPDQCRAWVQVPNQNALTEAARISIIGFPLEFFA